MVAHGLTPSVWRFIWLDARRIRQSIPQRCLRYSRAYGYEVKAGNMTARERFSGYYGVPDTSVRRNGTVSQMPKRAGVAALLEVRRDAR